MARSFSNLEESQYSCLPSQWKSIHPVVHISLLEPVKTATIPNWHQEPPPPIIIKEEEEWEVSQILDSNIKRGKLWSSPFKVGGTVTATCNHPPMGPRAISYIIGTLGQSSTSPTPRPIPFLWAWGVHLDFQEPLASWAHPFDNGGFGTFRPPMASMSHKWPKGPQDPNWPLSTPGLWQSPEATKSNSARFPLHSGERIIFINVLRTMDSGKVHIWYNIPSCNNFAQQSNGDGFTTKLGHFKNKSSNTSPILKEVFSIIQSCTPWRLPEDHSRTPTTWPCRSWVVLFFRILPREILRGYQAFNQLSRHQVLQYPLGNSIGPYRLYSRKLYGIGPFGTIHIPLWEFNHMVQFSRWPDLY
ncbi:hypothetical protein O181_012449 [Austropuccinia psidii MF-1]|uniref:Uncharacterized protein n=1 Tax=Austropuccinia psidii MF-1 TaxID=1389203 RepID=A0A9Q3GMW1_9BASI|nr:hypothetical protein [Austropuccinia psidii MF-1]